MSENITVQFFPSQRAITAPKGDFIINYALRADEYIDSPCGGTGKCKKCTVWINKEPVLACKTRLLINTRVWTQNPTDERNSEEKGVWEDGSVSSRSSIRVETGDPILPLCPERAGSGAPLGLAIDLGTTTIAAALVLLPEGPNLRVSKPVLFTDGQPSSEGQEVGEKDRNASEDASREEIRAVSDIFERVRQSTLEAVGCINSQTAIGGDVISRIQYEIDNPESGLKRLNQLIIDDINQLIYELLTKCSASAENVKRIVAAGNTTMESLFAGVSVCSLGVSPFRPTLSLAPSVLTGIRLGLNCCQTTVQMLPCIGGFLGGDTVAGIYMINRILERQTNALQTEPSFSGRKVWDKCGQTSFNSQQNSRSEYDVATEINTINKERRGQIDVDTKKSLLSSQPWLLIDIGTNGEIVLCDRNKKYWGTSAAAGPAFEGAGISCGMRAAPGAIDRVELKSDGTFAWQTIDACPPQGICGSGLLDLIACLLQTGGINQRGKLLTPLDRPLNITQLDVRQVQLAVGAIKTAITILLRKAELTVSDLQTVYIAGGFGKRIKAESILKLGFIPDGSELLTSDQIEYIGNSSLWSAQAALVDQEAKQDLLAIAQSVQAVNLASESGFAEDFAKSMLFPANK